MKNRGFTLIELSISLVIIGLITAAVVGGQGLVLQSRIKAMLIDVEEYRSAIRLFEDEYKGLPGDFADATRFGIGTDGDGDGIIYTFQTEQLYFWQHLANADLIKGNYTGAVVSGSQDYGLGINHPKSNFSNVGYMVGYIGKTNNCFSTADLPLFGVIDNIHVIQVGKIEAVSFKCPRHGFLNSENSYLIDEKFDDASADSGNIFAANSDNDNIVGNRCVDNNVQGTGGANYDLTDDGKNCRLLFTF